MQDSTLRDTAGGGGGGWKTAAFSQYPRCMNSTQAAKAPFLATADPCVGHPADQVCGTPGLAGIAV